VGRSDLKIKKIDIVAIIVLIILGFFALKVVFFSPDKAFQKEEKLMRQLQKVRDSYGEER
jgi:hypothetical protein